MAKIKTIEDESNGIIYPVTSSKAVYHNGQLASEILDEVCVEGADGTKIPKSFIDGWNLACGSAGKWNDDTRYFELNGILDIGYNEAFEIMFVGRDNFYSYGHSYKIARTNMPSSRGWFATSTDRPSFNTVFAGNRSLEVIVIPDGVIATNWTGCFFDNRNLTKIVGKLSLNYNTPKSKLFYYCNSLESFRCINESDLELIQSPNLDEDTLTDLIVNTRRYNQTTITITLHKTAYDRAMNIPAVVESLEEKKEWLTVITE